MTNQEAIITLIDSISIYIICYYVSKKLTSEKCNLWLFAALSCVCLTIYYHFMDIK